MNENSFFWLHWGAKCGVSYLARMLKLKLINMHSLLSTYVSGVSMLAVAGLALALAQGATNHSKTNNDFTHDTQRCYPAAAGVIVVPNPVPVPAFCTGTVKVFHINLDTRLKRTKVAKTN